MPARPPATPPATLFQQALNGPRPGLEGSFANPFGASDLGVIDAIRSDNTNRSTFETAAFDVFVTARGWENRFGPTRYSYGLEARTEAINDRRRARSEAGQIVGGLEGESYRASREVYAVFAEVAAPIAPRVKIRGAARAEYSTDVGDTTKPKVSIAYRVTDRLTLRASYGGAFLAPGPAHLNAPRLATFFSCLIVDPNPDRVSFNAQSQIQTNTGGNPDLRPEETEVYSAGFSWAQSESSISRHEG